MSESAQKPRPDSARTAESWDCAISAGEGRCTDPLLAELEGTLIETLGEELHGAALVRGEAGNLTDHVACKLDLDPEFLRRGGTHTVRHGGKSVND